jgi:hypothetical protein
MASPVHLRSRGIKNKAIKHITISVTYSLKRVAYYNICFDQISEEGGSRVAPHDVGGRL